MADFLEEKSICKPHLKTTIPEKFSNENSKSTNSFPVGLFMNKEINLQIFIFLNFCKKSSLSI